MKPLANDQVSEFGRGSFRSFREAEASVKSSTVVSWEKLSQNDPANLVLDSQTYETVK